MSNAALGLVYSLPSMPSISPVPAIRDDSVEDLVHGNTALLVFLLFWCTTTIAVFNSWGSLRSADVPTAIRKNLVSYK